MRWKINACDDLRFSVMIYYYEGVFVREWNYHGGRIEKKWIFRVGSEKHEADNCVIVNLPREASGRWEKFERKSAGWEKYGTAKRILSLVVRIRKCKENKVLSTDGACEKLTLLIVRQRFTMLSDSTSREEYYVRAAARKILIVKCLCLILLWTAYE